MLVEMDLKTETTTVNRRLEKAAIQCSADTFMINSLVIRINICGEYRHLRQAPKL